MQRRYDGVTEDFSLSRLHLTTEVGQVRYEVDRKRTHPLTAHQVDDGRGHAGVTVSDNATSCPRYTKAQAFF